MLQTFLIQAFSVYVASYKLVSVDQFWAFLFKSRSSNESGDQYQLFD